MRKFSEEHKRKIGESSRGRRLSDEAKKKVSEFNRGKVLSPETRKKVSLNHGMAKSIVITDLHTQENFEFRSLIEGYRYLKSIGVKASQQQYSNYLIRMAKGLEPQMVKSKDLYRYKARYK